MQKKAFIKGWICDPRKINGQWIICFDNAEDLPEYPIIAVKEKDLKVVKERD